MCSVWLHTHTHTHTHTYTHILSFSLSHTHTHARSHACEHTCKHILTNRFSLCLSRTHAHTHTHALTYANTHANIFSQTVSLSVSRARTLSLSLSLFLTHTNTHTHLVNTSWQLVSTFISTQQILHYNKTKTGSSVIHQVWQIDSVRKWTKWNTHTNPGTLPREPEKPYSEGLYRVRQHVTPLSMQTSRMWYHQCISTGNMPRLFQCKHHACDIINA